MSKSPEQIRESLDRYLDPDFRGRLRARGIARGMVWRNGVVPEGSPAFPDGLSGDLLHFGYGVLALALELRDVNRTREPATRFPTADAFEFAAEAIESAVRRGDSTNGEYGRHLVVGAAAFHLAGFAARSYSLLPPSVLDKNLASGELALALLLQRDLLKLRELIVSWLVSEGHSDDVIARRLQDPEDDFGPDDAVVLALTTAYFRALGLGDTALISGELAIYERVMVALAQVIDGAVGVGNLPMWWVATLTTHLFRDLWEQCLHSQLPMGPRDDLPSRWDELRRDFIAQLGVRNPPHIDLWPSQLEAAKRSIDPADDLVIALPTSAGKTKIAELCILRALADERRVIYVTPLRALSAQVERVLARTFVPLGATVSSLYGAIGTSTVDDETLANADIVVSTPEKFDFALRQDPHVLDDVGLIVLDEGHMIGLGSREIRYEVLIQRLLRREDASARRLVCLSAMYNPKDAHFQDFTAWLRSDVAGNPVHVEWRPTRQRLAQLDWNPHSNAARLAFLEGEEAFVLRFVEGQPPHSPRRTPFPKDETEFCIAAANAFAREGHNVLVYSPQRSQIDPLVREFKDMHQRQYFKDIEVPKPAELATALSIGREWLGEQHAAVQALEIGVGTHHGALPRPFQSAIEDLLDKKRLPVVVASPTLAQGVDLSCSVLLFRALTRFDPETNKPKLISPAEFANVVGRAGRAYVDLDGLVVLPSFEAGWSRDNRHRQFQELTEASRGQRLISGLVYLVWELATRICTRLGIDIEGFLENVLNSDGPWSDERLQLPENLDEDEDEATRSLDEYIGDLDVAILALVDDMDAPPGQLADKLDEILKDSLWKRTVAHLESETERKIEREVIVSRAKWLWGKTTVDERRACFSSGLGQRAGTFLYRNLDGLVTVLAELQCAVVSADVERVSELTVKLAEGIVAEQFFSVRNRPDNWSDVLKKWVSGVAFADILKGLGVRQEQRTQAFVQDGVIFRLVWAAESVRVQAISSGHVRAKELGDGPMLALTHGVPSIPAALLCQAGYASRVGALWVTRARSASFTDLDGMRRWMEENDAVLSGDGFWQSADHRILWNQMQRPTGNDFPRRWHRRETPGKVQWFAGKTPPAGTSVRLLARPERSAIICGQDLSSLGIATFSFNLEGAALEAVVQADGKLSITYFGPN